MHKIDSAGATAQNEFTDGDPAQGLISTVVWSKWLNTIQRELVAICVAGEVALNAATDTHIAQAIANLIAAHSNLTNPHGATSAATAARIMLRDAAGRVKAVAGAAAGDVVIYEQLPGSASTSAAGIVEIADATETAALALATRAVSPSTLLSGVKAALNAAGSAPVYAARALAVVDLSGSPDLTGTYTQSGTTVTVTCSGHGYLAGHIIRIGFSSGTAVAGWYTVLTATTNSFTYTAGTSLSTSGACTMYRDTLVSGKNVSSVTESADGIFELNFAIQMPELNYCYMGSGRDTDTVGDVIIGRSSDQGKTLYSLGLHAVSSDNVLRDFPEITVAIFC